MERIRRSLIPGVAIAAALVLILAQALPGPSARAQAPGGVGPRSMPGDQPVTLVAGKGVAPFRVPPRQPAGGVRVQNASFVVNYMAAGTSTRFGDTCQTWPTNAKTAFDFATAIWGVDLNSAVPVKINACWADMGTTGILGHSGANNFWKDFQGAPSSGTWYPVALANALRGSDLSGTGEFAMDIAYNSNGVIPWYLGTDGHPPMTKYDFVSVVLHEIAHGLGFAGSMRVAGGGVGSWGGGTGFPHSYDRFTENGFGQKLITAFSNNSIALATQLTSNNIYFNGTKANAANGGNRPKLYAPTSWSSGSSYAHLDEIFNGTANALMTFSLNDGEAVHDPGPVSMGILQDVGWTVPVAPPTPTRTNTPTVMPTTPTATPVSKVYLPLVLRSYGTSVPTPTATPVPGLGIHGHVNFGGSAASGVSLLLRVYNGAAWSTWGTASTNVSGNYSFVGAPTLGPGQAYYVRYDNSLSSNTRLSFWQAPLLNSYTAGASADGGSFDVANIALSSPPGDSILPLPVTFRWGVRPATPSDSYEFDIFEYAFGSGQAWSPPLGYVGQYVLSALPAGFSYPNTYGWYVGVYSPDGGYGESYYFRKIAFTNASMSVAEAPLTRPVRDRERLPLNLEP